MKLSARNVLAGTVSALKSGQVLVSVKIALTDGTILTASVTEEAARELDLKIGSKVSAVIKSTDIMIATE